MTISMKSLGRLAVMRAVILTLLVIIPSIVYAQIFYKVEGKGMKSPSYIFGTHHLAPLSVLDDIPEVTEAFSESETVVGEIEMSDMAASALVLQKYMMAPSDSTLMDIYGKDEFDRLNKEFKKWSGGLDLTFFNQFKPMVASATVGASMVAENLPGVTPGEQLDTYFQTVGVQAGKRVAALETIEEQSEFLFNSVSIADQGKAFKEQLDNPEKSMDEARMLNECYFSHDIDRLLGATVAESENPEFFETILYKRNSNWLERLPAILEAGPAFIAVGALHLAGPRGVISGLRNMGYEVTPIR